MSMRAGSAKRPDVASTTGPGRSPVRHGERPRRPNPRFLCGRSARYKANDGAERHRARWICDKIREDMLMRNHVLLALPASRIDGHTSTPTLTGPHDDTTHNEPANQTTTP